MVAPLFILKKGITYEKEHVVERSLEIHLFDCVALPAVGEKFEWAS